MILPSLFARVEKWRKFLSQWVNARDFVVLATITRQAGGGKIIEPGLAAF